MTNDPTSVQSIFDYLLKKDDEKKPVDMFTIVNFTNGFTRMDINQGELKEQLCLKNKDDVEMIVGKDKRLPFMGQVDLNDVVTKHPVFLLGG